MPSKVMEISEDENTSVSTIKSELDICVKCLKCFMSRPDQLEMVLDTLKTIVKICTNCKEGRDIFRELEGLTHLFNLLCNNESVLVLESCIDTLSFVTDTNVHNQKLMSSKLVFELIHGILNSSYITPSLQMKTAHFVAILVNHNNESQKYFQQTECLDDFIKLYEQTFPMFLLEHKLSEKWDDENGRYASLEMWLRVNSVLSFSANNPINEKNQIICSSLYPMALKILHSSSRQAVISAVTLFLNQTMEGNVNNKNLFAEYDGTVVLRYCLIKGMNSVLLDIKHNYDIALNNHIDSVTNIIAVLNVSLTMHSENSEVAGKLGCISILLKFLNLNIKRRDLRTNIVLTLGHSVDAYEQNVSHLIKNTRLVSLLDEMMLSEKGELYSACRYLAQVCLRNSALFGEKYNMSDRLNHLLSDQEVHNSLEYHEEEEPLSPARSEEDDDDDCMFNHLSQQYITSVEHVSGDLSSAKNGLIFPQESIVIDLEDDETSHDKSPGGENENIFPCGDENIYSHSHQNRADCVSQACDVEKEVLTVVQGNETRIRCDNCFCKLRVVSKYLCGCCILHGCHCLDVYCKNSIHSCPRLVGQAKTSSYCAQSGCEKRCGLPSCVHPHKLYRKGLSNLCSKQRKENLKISDTVQPSLHGDSKGNSESSSKSISKFQRKISPSEKKVKTIFSTSEEPLKEKKTLNQEIVIKPKPIADFLLKKPLISPAVKQTQTLVQSNGSVFKKPKVAFPRLHSLKSDVGLKYPGTEFIQFPEKRELPTDQALVSFSPFRKIDARETEVKGEDTQSVFSEAFSVSDAKLLKTMRKVPTSRVGMPQTKTKSHQNNANSCARDTVSKYFALNKPRRDQEENIKVEFQSVKSAAVCSKFSAGESSTSIPDLSSREKPVTSVPSESSHTKSGAGKSDGKCCDDEVEVISVFGSKCSQHELSNNSKVVQVITL